MPNVLFPPDGPQSVSQVLDTGFRIFKISLVRCLLFGAMAMIAGQLPNIYSLLRGVPFGGYLRGEPVAVVLAILGNLLAVYFSAVILIHQREIGQGTRLPIRAELAEALRRMGALIGVTLVSGALLAIVPVGLLVLPDFNVASASLRIAFGVGAAIVTVPVAWLLPGL